jgi:hypothetical protein
VLFFLQTETEKTGQAPGGIFLEQMPLSLPHPAPIR